MADLLASIPNQLGFLVLGATGDIVSSGGELKDDVNTSKVLFKLVHDAGKAAASKENDGLKRVTGADGQTLVVKRPL